MSSTPQGIQNYSKMNDKDKAYVVKLMATIISAIFTGLFTGAIYNYDGGIAGLGFGIFLVVTLGMAFFIKKQYDLSDMTDAQIVRHGIMISLLSYIFVWSVILNFIIF